jgi:hypothetical protein
VPRLSARLTFALLSAWCAGARAEADAVSITWQAEGAPPCTKPAAAEADVLRLAGAAAAPAKFRVRCETLSDSRQRCVVRLAEQDAQTERVLASCDEAREAVLLIMAMALTPSESASVESASLGATAGAPSPSSSSSSSRRPERQDRSRPQTARWLLSLAALADYRTLPRVSFGPALGVSFAATLWRLGLVARYLPPGPVADLPPGVEAEIEWFAGALSPSLVWRLGAWGVGPRAELELGMLRGRAHGVEESAPATALWVAASAGAELEVWLHRRVGLTLLALAGLPLQRPRFGFADDAPFYTAAPGFVRGTLGVTFRIDAATKE